MSQATPETASHSIRYHRAGHIGRLLLNRPERHNALGREQIDALRACFIRIAADDVIRVLVLSGAGDRTFCAGAALDELDPGVLESAAFQQMTTELAALPVPTICAMNGDVYGGGVELALSCDFRIGVQGMRMQVPAAAIGLCYPLSGIERFVSILGPGAARRILMSAEQFEDTTLLQLGFIDHFVAAAELEHAANELATRIAGLAPLAVRAMKEIVQGVAMGTWNPGRARELELLCLNSADLREGLTAKRERRTPTFIGK